MRKPFMVALAIASFAVMGGARAQQPKRPEAPHAVPATAAADLKSGDPTKMRAALDDIRMAGKSGAPHASAIVELLQKGLPLSVTEPALDTLGDLEVEASSAAIAPYARHRNAKIRQAAVRALGKTKGKAAVAALRGALSDSDAAVRGLAATGLGNMKAKEATPDLFLALDHRVNEAAAAIGLVCAAEDCEKLTQRVGKLPFDVVTSGLDQAFFRTDLPEDAKIKIVGHVRELGTPDANKFLRDIQKRMTAGSPRIKQAIDQAVAATGGGS